MFKPPENMGMGEPQKDTDLDFTRPGTIPGIEVKEDFSTIEEKKQQLRETIKGFERIILEKKDQPDLARVAEDRKREFEETLAMLEQKKPLEEFWVPEDDEDVADFTKAVGNEYGGSINKMEKRGF